MKTLTFVIIALLVWAHVGPHFYNYNQFVEMKKVVPACELKTEWDWYGLKLRMGAVNCINVTE